MHGFRGARQSLEGLGQDRRQLNPSRAWVPGRINRVDSGAGDALHRDDQINPDCESETNERSCHQQSGEPLDTSRRIAILHHAMTDRRRDQQANNQAPEQECVASRKRLCVGMASNWSWKALRQMTFSHHPLRDKRLVVLPHS